MMEEKIIEIIQEKMVVFREISNKDNLRLKLGIDSLDLVELKMLFEEEFLVEVTFEKMESWETVQDIIDTIKEAKDGRDK